MPEIGNSAVWFQADGSNLSGTMPSWNGSASPNTIDDAGRAMMGAITREWNWRNPTLTSGGSANTQTLTYSVAPAALYDGQIFSFIVGFTNTGTATLNINALGALTIKKNVAGTWTALSGSELIAGDVVTVAYDLATTSFWIMSTGIRSVFVSSWEELRSEVSVGTGTTYTIDNTIITKAYRTFKLILSVLSHNSGSSQTFRVEISGNNGSTWGGIYDISTSIPAVSTESSIVVIDRASITSGLRSISSISNTGGGKVSLASVTTGYINAIRVSPSAGNFDGGTATLLGEL